METNALTSRLWRFRGPAFLCLAYYLAGKIAHTLLLTIVTSFILIAYKDNPDLSNLVNEIADQYTLIAYALAALLVAGTVHLADKALYRSRFFWNEEKRPPWQLDHNSQQELFRGLSSALLVVTVLVVILFANNQVNFLGIFITSAVGTPVFPLFLSNTLCLLLLLASEEFIFRHKILYYLQRELSPVHAIVISALAATLLRSSQFDLTAMDKASLFLLNAALGVMYVRRSRAHRGLAFVVVFFTLLHPLAGFPLWGHNAPSFFLFKHTSKAAPLLTGGEAGPLASIGMLSLFVLLLAGSYARWRREN